MEGQIPLMFIENATGEFPKDVLLEVRSFYEETPFPGFGNRCAGDDHRRLSERKPELTANVSSWFQTSDLVGSGRGSLPTSRVE